MLKNSKQFAQFRRKVESDYHLKGLPLESALIKPIQRICRYPLLLGELKKSTPIDSPQMEKLSLVIDKFNEAVLTINEIRRESEMMNKAFGIERLQIPGLETFEFWGDRRLLREEKDATVSKVTILFSFSFSFFWGGGGGKWSLLSSLILFSYFRMEKSPSLACAGCLLTASFWRTSPQKPSYLAKEV